MSENNNSVWLIACRPSGIIAILLWFCIALMLSSNASAADLMSNGDFETGDFTGWTHYAGGVNGASAYSGSYGYYYSMNNYFPNPFYDMNIEGISQSIDLTDVDELTYYHSMSGYNVGGGVAGLRVWLDTDTNIGGSGTGAFSYVYNCIDVSGYTGVHVVHFGSFVSTGIPCTVQYIARYDDITAEEEIPSMCSINFNPNVSISNQTQQYFNYSVNDTYEDYMYFVTSVWHAPGDLPDLYLIENWLNVEQEGENIQLDNPFSDLQTYHLNLYATTSAPPDVYESFLIASSNDIYINRSYTGSIPPIPDPEPEPDPYEPDPNPIEDPNTTIPDDWNMTIPDKYQNVSWLTNYTGYFDDLTSFVNNTLYSVTGLVIGPLQSLNETVYSLRYHISNSKNMVAEYSYLSVIVYYGWRVLPVEMQTIFIGVAAAGACIYLFKRRT